MSCESSASQPREPGSSSGRDACTALSARPLHPVELHHNSTTAVLLPPFIHGSTTTPPHSTTAPTATAQGPTARAGRAVDEWRQQQGRRRTESRHWRYARSLRRRVQLVIMARPGSVEHARRSTRPSWLAALTRACPPIAPPRWACLPTQRFCTLVGAHVAAAQREGSKPTRGKLCARALPHPPWCRCRQPLPRVKRADVMRDRMGRRLRATPSPWGDKQGRGSTRLPYSAGALAGRPPGREVDGRPP